MKFYIVDTTIKPQTEKRFDTYPEVVNYLGTMSQRAYKQTRKERMILLEELGGGNDDTNSVNFVRAMAEVFEIGVIRNNAGVLNRMRCDITSIAMFQQEEFGS